MELHNKIAIAPGGDRGIGNAISITLVRELAPQVAVNAAKYIS